MSWLEDIDQERTERARQEFQRRQEAEERARAAVAAYAPVIERNLLDLAKTYWARLLNDPSRDWTLRNYFLNEARLRGFPPPFSKDVWNFVWNVNIYNWRDGSPQNERFVVRLFFGEDGNPTHFDVNGQEID